MFIATKRIKKIYLITAAVAAVLILIVCRFFVCADGVMTTATSQIGQYQLAADTNEERVAFLAQFGWEVEDE